MQQCGFQKVWKILLLICEPQSQAMTEAAFFTIRRSRTIGYGKIRPLADYRSRSRMLIFFLIFLTFILFIDSSSSINSFNQFLTRPCENWTLIILTHLIFQKFNLQGWGAWGIRIAIKYVIFKKIIGYLNRPKTSAAEAEGRLLKSFGIGRLCSASVIV